MVNPKAHFNSITKFYYRKKRMPSYREIMQLTGFKSTNAVHRLVEKLAGQGLVEKEKNGRLMPRKAFFAVPLLGTVEAGFPTDVEEELAEALSLDEFLIRNREATYVLVVSGDSMKDAGIMPGDMVLVERGSPAKSGDIVIAQVDGQWTLKYLRKRGAKVYLEPANKRYQPIFPRQELKVAAVAKAVIRRYWR